MYFGMRGNAVSSINPLLASGSENEDNLAVLKVPLESNRHDMADVREDGSRGNINSDMGESSNRSSHDYLDDNDMCWNFLGIKSCFSCNEGGELLVCSVRDCPINLHAKCLCIEPKFDDKGNFYCPYCWYKRAWAEAQESREKAISAKKDLSKFFFQNGITSGVLAENDVGVRSREPKGVSVMENGSGSLDYQIRPCNKSVHSHTLKTLQDLQKEGERLTVGTDRHRIVVEDIANAHGPEANTNVSSSREEFDILTNHFSKTHETRFVEGQARIKLEDLRYSDDFVHAMIAEDIKPLSAFCVGESTDGRLPDYAFAKVLQGVEVYVDKGREKDREKLVQNELNLSATDCSVSGTGDSDSEPFHVKQEGSNSETLGLLQRSSLRSKKMTLESGKRKRLNWTVEEVNMLKEGVLKFGMDQRSIPWKKILEFGCHVFHSKRNTADLKDKWKHLKF